jgi:phage protein D
MMAGNKAGLRLALDNGVDLAAKINPRFLSLTLVEKRDGSADELTIALQNVDGKLAVPRAGAILSLALGWESRFDTHPVGLSTKAASASMRLRKAARPIKSPSARARPIWPAPMRNAATASGMTPRWAR